MQVLRVCLFVADGEKWTSGRSDLPQVGPSLAFLVVHLSYGEE